MTAYQRRSHSDTAPPTTLTTGINTSDLSFTVANGTGYPDGSGGVFIVTLDVGVSTEEKILCTSRAGNVFTVDPAGRGFGGTTPAAHAGSTGTVWHTASGVELDELSEVAAQTLGQIGAKGDLWTGNAQHNVVATPVGQDALALTADSTQPGGVKWQQPAPAAHDHGTGHGEPIPISSVTGLGTALSNVLPLAGGTLSGPLILEHDGALPLEPVTREQLDAEATARNNADNAQLPLAGGTMTGDLVLFEDATVALGAATKQQSVQKAGDTMTGLLVLSADPAAALGAATKQYVDKTKRGKYTATPDVNGNLTWPHGVGSIPGTIQLTLLYPTAGSIAAALIGVRGDTDATNIIARVFHADGTTPFTGSNVTVHWTASP